MKMNAMRDKQPQGAQLIFISFLLDMLLQEEFKGIFDDGHVDFLEDDPFDPCKRPEEKVNDAPKERAVNFIANDG